MKTRKNKKGISLIVLVITIIVMIILAAAIIISISNSGIVNRANTAVEETNEKQMKELVSLAWAEAYLKDTTVTKNDAYYYDEVIAYLKGSGITQEELDKYIITATTQGADANLKSKVAVKNEYGFYFDTLYLGTVEGNTMGITKIGFVFHEDGSAEGFGGNEQMGDALYCMAAYSEGALSYSENAITIGEDNATFTNDGMSLSGTFEGLAVTAEYSNKELHSLYYNREYSGEAMLNDTPVVITTVVDSNNNATTTINLEDGTQLATTTVLANITAHGYIVNTDGTELGLGSTVVTYVSTDGKSVLVNRDTILYLTNNVSGDGEETEDTGISHNGTIPEGGVYYVGVTSTTLGDYTGATATFTAGQSFPTIVNTGDVYVYGDYEYRYNMGWLGLWGETSGLEGLEEYTGWGVRVLDTTKASYGDMLSSINNEWVSFVIATFGTCESLTVSPKLPSNAKVLQVAYSGCTKLEEAPIIPSTVVNMMQTFNGCVKLKTAPVIPDSVTILDGTFWDCTQLKTVLAISKNVKNMDQTFINCTSLEVAPEIPSSVTSLEMTFEGCVNLLAVPDLSNVINVVNMNSTFAGCEKITTPPDLTNLTKLENMSQTFDGCVALKTAPIIPESVTEMSRTFADCVALETAPTIPSKVTDVRGLFCNCTNLTGDVEINSSPIEYNSSSCFAGTVKPIKIIGACTTKSVLAATATNGNVTY